MILTFILHFFLSRFLKKISDDPNLEKYYVPKKEIKIEAKPEANSATTPTAPTPVSATTPASATSPVADAPKDAAAPQPNPATAAPQPEQPKEKSITKKNIDEILEFLMKLDAEILEADAIFKSLCNINFTSVDAKTTFVPPKGVDNYDKIEIATNTVLKNHFEEEITKFLTFALSNIQIYSMAQNLTPNPGDAKGSFLSLIGKGNKPMFLFANYFFLFIFLNVVFDFFSFFEKVRSQIFRKRM